MDDLRPVLERLRDGSEPPSGGTEGFESLSRRRHRRSLRRRIAAGALASVVAVAGFAVLVRAFDSHQDVISEPTLPDVAPKITTSFPVGTRGQVGGIVAGFGSLWITAYGVPGGGGPDDAALLRVDPVTDQVADVIPVGGVSGWVTGGGGVAVGEDSIWVAGYDRIDGAAQGTLSRVDPTSLEVEVILLGGEPASADVSVSRDGVWVTGRIDGVPRLTHVDPEFGKIDAPEVPLRGETARQVVSTDDVVMTRQWDWHGGDGPCGIATSIDPGAVEPIAESPDPGTCGGIGELFVWDEQVWTSMDGGFSRLDPASASPVGQTYPFTTEHAFPRSGPVIDPTTGVWFGAYPGGNGSAPDQLSRFDPSSGTIETFDVEVGWSAAAVLDGTLWALGWEGELTRIDLFDERTFTPAASTRMEVDGDLPIPPGGRRSLPARSRRGLRMGPRFGGRESSPSHRRAAARPSDRSHPEQDRGLRCRRPHCAREVGVGHPRGEGGGSWVTMVDRGSGVPLESIALPSGASTGAGAIVAHEGSLWVSVASLGDAHDQQPGVIRIDPRRREVVAEVAAPVCQSGCFPSTELVGAGGAVWAAGAESGTTVRIDVATEQVDVLATGAVAGFATDGDRVWVAIQPEDEPVSATRWWDGHLELVALDARSGRIAEGPIPMTGPGWPFAFAGVPFAVAGGDVYVWGLNADQNGLVVSRLQPDGSAADDSIEIADIAFLEGGRAVLDETTNVLWILGSYDLTKISLPGS